MQVENCKLNLAERAARLATRYTACRSVTCDLQFTLLILQFCLLTLVVGIPTLLAATRPPAKQKLLDRSPFDEIILNKANGGATVEVLPLSLPQRPLTTIPKSGTLKVRLLDRPTEDFAVAWSSVAQLRVFEQILLDEAQRLVAAGKFDEAYDYFDRLRTDYPNFPGLDDAICDYLQRNALALYQDKQSDRALAMLLTLYQRNPSYAGLTNAVPAVAGEIIQRYLREGKFGAARRVLDLWQKQFGGVAAKEAADWQHRFESAASREVADANRLLTQKQYIQARKALGRALSIWPSLDSATNTLAQLQREFPFVTVGVLEAAPHQPAWRIDDWASLRAARLTERLLAQEDDFGTEGGVYGSPFGKWALDETGRNLTLKLASTDGGLTTDALSRFLLSMATHGNPNYRSDFASLLGSVSVERGNAVTLHLRRVHVRPEALLQVPPPGAANRAGAYSVAAYSPDQVVFDARKSESRPTGPQAIVEQTMPSDEAALTALQTGEIDVLDRVPPWQVARLRELPDVHVASYKLPTVHVLIPNLKRPLLAQREFRRALCFGINRQWIVERVLLGGDTIDGFQAISGPFPAGASLNDPIRYGYNDQIAPRPFEPRLAAILATVAWANVQKDASKNKNKSEISNIRALTLAYPNDPVARVACQSIQAQLVREDIPITLREFTADELATRQGRLRFAIRRTDCRGTGHGRAADPRPQGSCWRCAQPLSRRGAPRFRRSNELERRSRPPRRTARNRQSRTAGHSPLANRKLFRVSHDGPRHR